MSQTNECLSDIHFKKVCVLLFGLQVQSINEQEKLFTGKKVEKKTQELKSGDFCILIPDESRLGVKVEPQ